MVKSKNAKLLSVGRPSTRSNSALFESGPDAENASNPNAPVWVKLVIVPERSVWFPIPRLGTAPTIEIVFALESKFREAQQSGLSSDVITGFSISSANPVAVYVPLLVGAPATFRVVMGRSEEH